ncbi:MAG: glycosyltransferase family 39 protein [Chloroflexi bacterium]|nr:glycosyltransferase family 39 protein [Chloroflexota bacterium]
MKSMRRLVSVSQNHPHWTALALLATIIGITNWQLMLHVGTHVVGRPFDDVFGILWGLDWTQHAIFDLQVSPLFAPDIFYPHGFYLGSSSPPVWWFVVFAPLTRVLGSVLTYNLVSLTAYVLAGFGVYRLITQVSGRWLAGMLGGCVYMLAPVLTLRLGGHTDILLSSMWLPYLGWFSHRVLHSQQRRDGLLAGVFLGLACLGHWQFVFFAPLIPLVIIGTGESPNRWTQRLARLGVIGLVGGLVAAPFAALTVFSRTQMFEETPNFPITMADVYSLSIDRLFVPNPSNGLWGEASRAAFPVHSEAAVVSIGYATLAIAAVGAFRRWPQRRVYVVLLGVSMILAMGITLHWNEQPAVVMLPPALARVIRPVVESLVGSGLMPPGDATVIPLPLSVLYRVFPFLTVTRVWARYMIPGMLAVAVLAGAGATWIAGRFRGRATAPLIIIIGLVCFEGLTTPYPSFTRVAANARPVDRWLAAQSPPVALIEYPLPVASKLAMYRQSLHWQQVANGYASVEPTYFAQAASVLGTWPTEASMELLRDWQIDYVLINGANTEKFLNETLPPIQSVPGLCLEREDNEPELNRHTYLFKVSATGQACGTVQ